MLIMWIPLLRIVLKGVSHQNPLDREAQIKIVEDHNASKLVIDNLHIIGRLWASEAGLKDGEEATSLLVLGDQPQVHNMI